MEIYASYSLALWGVFIILLTVLLQSLVAAGTKASQPGAIPGKMDDSLSHSSFVFRSNRTVMNSLENLPVMLGLATKPLNFSSLVARVSTRSR